MRIQSALFLSLITLLLSVHPAAGAYNGDVHPDVWLEFEEAYNYSPEIFRADFDPETLLNENADLSMVPASTASGWGIQVVGHPGTDGKFKISPSEVMSCETKRGIAVTVENIGTKDIGFYLTGYANASGHGSFFMVRPGETKTGYVHFYRRETLVPIPQYMTDVFGSHGAYPGGFTTKYDYQSVDVSRCGSIKLKWAAEDGDRDVQFIVHRAWAAGHFYWPDQAVVTQPSFSAEVENVVFPDNWPHPAYQDDFGQYVHDDWPDKVRGVGRFGDYAAGKPDDGTVRWHHERELADLAANPEPPEWNQYAGWANGPQLTATGHFRTEKFNGKWWFVDPEGKLFLAQGLLHHGVDNRLSSIDELKGFTSEDQVREFWFKRVRSWGLNAPGGMVVVPSKYSHLREDLGLGTPYIKHIDNKSNPAYTVALNDSRVVPADFDEAALRAELRADAGVFESYNEDPWCIGFFRFNEIGFENDQAAEKFFRIHKEELERMAPNKLWLGSKVGGGSVDGIKGDHIEMYSDVISIDVLTKLVPPPLSYGYMKIRDKPIMMGAFSIGALDRGSFVPAGNGVLEQEQKKRFYVHYARRAYRDSEHNIGLLQYDFSSGPKFYSGNMGWRNSAGDRPFYEMVAAGREVANAMYRARAGLEWVFPDGVENSADDIDAAPIAYAYTYQTEANTSKEITLIGLDSEDLHIDPLKNKPLSYTIIDPPAGNLTNNGNGSFTYVPAGGDEGYTDTFTFTVTDSAGQQSNIATASVRVKGLVAHWEMEDGAGSAVTDSSSNGHHGIFDPAADNPPRWIGGSPVGDSTGALDFSNIYSTYIGLDPEQGYIEMIDEGAMMELTEPISLPDDWTLALWILRRDSGPMANLITGDNGVSIRLEQLDDSGKVGISYDDHDWIYEYSAPIDSWTHLAFVKKDRKVTLYADGVAIHPEDPIDHTPNVHGGILRKDLKLSITHLASVLNGALDDVKIYNHALSGSEIETLYSGETYIDYHLSRFEERSDNIGAINNTLTMTLVNGGIFSYDVTNYVSVTNLPTSLSPLFTRVSDTEVSLSLDGAADSHFDSDDVGDLTVTFSDGAFTGGLAAANVSNSMRNDLLIDFSDPWLTISTTEIFTGETDTFIEFFANDGSIGNYLTFTLEGPGESYHPGFSTADVTVANVPGGLSPRFVRLSDKVVKMYLDGKAASHDSSDTINNLSVAFQGTAFTGGDSSNIAGSSRNDFRVEFYDAGVSRYEAEDAYQGGTAISTYEPDYSGSGYSAYSNDDDNYVEWEIFSPWDTEATLLFRYQEGGEKQKMEISVNGKIVHPGEFLPYARDVWMDSPHYGVQLERGQNIIRLKALNNGPDIDYLEVFLLPPTISYSTGILHEADGNRGTVAETLTMTLSRATFAADLVSGGHVEAGNVPAGMSAVFTRVSNSVVSMKLTGSADSHYDSDDVGNLTVSFDEKAVVGYHRPAGSYRDDLQVDFYDPRIIVTPNTFREAYANDGSIAGSLTFAIAGGGKSFSTDVTDQIAVMNCPTGLTPSFYRYSDTTLIMYLKDRATSHQDSNDIGNLSVTFGDACFIGGGADHVTDSSRNDLVIDFISFDDDTRRTDRYEAEDAILEHRGRISELGTDATASNEQYVRCKNNTYVYWTAVTAPWSGRAQVRFRYQPPSIGRTLNVAVNTPDSNWDASTAVSSGSSDEWIFSQPVEVSLNKGNNTILLYSKYINIDYMEVTFLPPGTPDIRVKGNGFEIPNGDVSPRTADNTDFDIISTGVSIERTFTVRNLGEENLQLIGSPRVMVSGSPFFTVSRQTAASVSPTGSTSFTVKFSPTAVGLAEATVYLASSDPDSNPYSFKIQGTGALIPEMELLGNGLTIVDGDATPSPADNTDFGTAKIRSGAVDHIFTITNIGSAPLYLNGSPRVAVAGKAASDFVVIADPTNPVAKGGSSTSFVVRFVPNAKGIRTGTITIDNNDPDESPYTFMVQGEGALFPWSVFLPAILSNPE